MVMNINPSKLERFFATYEFKAPHLLCTSDCQSFSVKDLYDLEPGAEDQFKRFNLGYTEPQGDPELRRRIAALYDNTHPDDIIVCSGAEEGIFIFMNTVLEPGNQIIVQSPAYQSLYEIANAMKCQVIEWPMDPENNWNMDPEWLLEHITGYTKVIVVNFPANPTGYLPNVEAFQRIIDIARINNIYLFSDEVYRMLEYNSAHRLPAAGDLYEKAVSLGVMSKAFGLPGLRIGWVVIKNRDLFQKFSAFKDFTTICSSGPGEFFATLALKHKEAVLSRSLSIIQENLLHLQRFFSKYENIFDWNRPIAGPLSFPRFKPGNTHAFCLELVEQTGVLLLPGTMFNCSEPENYLRFGFGRRNMPEALDKLDNYLDALFR